MDKRGRIGPKTPRGDDPRGRHLAVATLLIKQHGDNAEVMTSLRVDQMAGRADDEGRALWVRIKRAVEELQARPSGLPH